MPDQLAQAEDAQAKATPVTTQVGEVYAGEEPPRELVVDELLVEDVSIDGMCGVY